MLRRSLECALAQPAPGGAYTLTQPTRPCPGTLPEQFLSSTPGRRPPPPPPPPPDAMLSGAREQGDRADTARLAADERKAATEAWPRGGRSGFGSDERDQYLDDVVG